jgi:hypothetical protein
MLLKHEFVIHLVDVVARENDDVFRRPVALDDVDVLEHGIGGAGVPLRLAHALAGGQDVEALIPLGAEEIPAALHVADQAVRLVLRGHRNAADARIERIGQGKVDDAGLATKIDGGLGAPVGHLHQSAAAPTRQNIGHGGPRQWRDRLYLVEHCFFLPLSKLTPCKGTEGRMWRKHGYGGMG